MREEIAALLLVDRVRQKFGLSAPRPAARLMRKLAAGKNPLWLLAARFRSEARGQIRPRRGKPELLPDPVHH